MLDRLSKVCLSAVIGIGALGSAFYALGLVINWTPSEPTGFWIKRSNAEPIRPGDMALACPPVDPQTRRYMIPGFCPGGFAPLLKEVSAVAGDTVIVVDRNGIIINGVWYPHTKTIPVDTEGRLLMAFPPGIYTVEPGTVWLLSPYADHGYDSRYFGPLPASQIVARVRPLWTFQ